MTSENLDDNTGIRKRTGRRRIGKSYFGIRKWWLRMIALVILCVSLRAFFKAEIWDEKVEGMGIRRIADILTAASLVAACRGIESR